MYVYNPIHTYTHTRMFLGLFRIVMHDWITVADF